MLNRLTSRLCSLLNRISKWLNRFNDYSLNYTLLPPEVPRLQWERRLWVNPATADLLLWVRGLEHQSLRRLVKAGNEEDIRELRGMVSAYHRIMTFLENARNGGMADE